MVTTRDYVDGSAKAELKHERVAAKWIQGEHSQLRVMLANRAFEIYHRAATSVRNVQDADHRNAMWKKLRWAASEGWGRGVSDLNEAFEHLVDNAGWWHDVNTENYYGGPNKCINLMLIKDAPEAAVNFLDAVDSGMKVLAEKIGAFPRQDTRITQAAQRNDWETVGQVLGQVKTGAEHVTPWLWTAPAYEAFGSQTVTFVDALGKVHSGATAYVEARHRAGWSSKESAAYAAMVVAVDFIPVLGAFYGEALKMIPGMLANWKRFINDYHRRRLHPERYRR